MPPNEENEEIPKLKRIRQGNAQTATQKCLFFKQATYLSIAFVIGYAFIGAFSPQALAWVDQFVIPFVDSLHFIGWGITKPPMDGQMPERFYINLVGLAIWSALAYNAVTIAYLICNKRLLEFEFSFDTARQRAMERKGWSPTQAAYVLHAIVYFGVLPLAAFWALALLNGSHGWFVFHAKGFFVAVITTLVFVFPGAFVSFMGYVVIRYISYDLSQLFLLFSREPK